MNQNLTLVADDDVVRLLCRVPAERDDVKVPGRELLLFAAGRVVVAALGRLSVARAVLGVEEGVRGGRAAGPAAFDEVVGAGRGRLGEQLRRAVVLVVLGEEREGLRRDQDAARFLVEKGGRAPPYCKSQYW